MEVENPEKYPIKFIDGLTKGAMDPEKLRVLLGSGFEFAQLSKDAEPTEILDEEKLNILLLDKEGFNQFPTKATTFYRLRFLLKASEKEVSSDLMEYEFIQDWFKTVPGEKAVAFSLLRARAEYVQRKEISRLQKQVYLNQRNLAELNKVGAALNSEHRIDRLLALILEKCMEITASDAGSLYLIVDEETSLTQSGKDGIKKVLNFKISKNQSREVAFTEFTMDISENSIAGSVALSGEVINILNVHDLPKDAPYTWNASIDETSGYHSESMVTVPMKNSKDEMIGVVQLINKKVNPRIKLIEKEDFEKYVSTFDKHDEALALSLASQAAVALDNARLYKNITNLFEGFIRASVTAIEARDPTTGGHSERVATLSVSTAEVINRVTAGPLSKHKFSARQLRELKYAGLLHDFGKIGVREEVLVKAKKLYSFELDKIHSRYDIIKKNIELDYAQKKNDFLLAYGNKSAKEHMDHLKISRI